MSKIPKKIAAKKITKRIIKKITPKNYKPKIEEIIEQQNTDTAQKEDNSLDKLIAITLHQVNTQNEREQKFNTDEINKKQNSIIIYEDGVELRMNDRMIQMVKNEDETFRIITKKKLPDGYNDKDYDPVKIRIEKDEENVKYGVMDFLISEDALSAIIVGYNKFNLSEKRVMNNGVTKGK
jgi:hypothetical protein